MWTYKPGSTPFSAVTNILYVLAGVGCFYSTHPASIVVGLSFIALGVGSGWYHILYDKGGQLMDERMMYVSFSAIAGAGYMAVVPPGLEIFAFMLVFGLGVLAAYFADHYLVDSMWMMPGWALAALYAVVLNAGWAAAGVIFLGLLIAELVREIPEDNFGPQRPESLKRLYDLFHGLWHIQTAYWMTVMAWAVFRGELILRFAL